MAVQYTPRQGQFLAYIHTYVRLNRQPPSEAEMAAYFGISPPAAHGMVVTLEKRGLIERVPGRARSIRVLVDPEGLPDLDGRQATTPETQAFEAKYPHLSDWVMGGGLVELGRTDGSRSLARVLDEGGMVWEGKARYRSVDELLRGVDEGIARWTEGGA